MNYRKRFLALVLALVMVLGMIPATGAEAAAVEYGEVMGYISTGDSTYVASEIPMYTAESMDALLDMYEDFGMKRVYWRGLQNELWNQSQYVLQDSIRGTYHSEGVREQFLEFEADHGMTIDEYFVTEAHKRGIQVIGVTSLSDWGSGADIPINGWPAGHNAVVREENFDWVPKDKYGLVDQGGAMEFSIADVRDWYVDLHVKEIEQVGYDGVLFITYSENYSINYNDQFGFSDEAVTEFYNRYGVMAGKEAFTKWASIYDWQRLRGEYVTELFRELKAALKADGEEEDVCLFLDARDPWHMQVWNANETLTNGIYMDLWTYVDEGLIDQFVVNGASTIDAQLTTTKNMIQLCEGTGTTVAINTSNAGAPQWDALQAQGVDILTYGSGEAMLYNRSDIAGKQTEDPELAVKLWLAQVAENKTTQNLAGNGTVTLDELRAYLDESAYNITIRRLALHAIMTLKPAGGADVVEQVLLSDSDSGVRAMAAYVLRFIGDTGSVDALIEAIYRYDEFAMVEAASVALYNNVNASSWRAALRSKFAAYAANDYNGGSDDNLRICASILRALNYVGEASDLALYQDLVDAFGPNDNTEVLLDYDLSEVQARQGDSETVLAKMDDIVQEMWYDAIRYYAAAGIGNINSTAAFEELYTLAAGDDTITSTPALIALGNRATSATMTGDYRTRALAVLDEVFGECGDGSTRVDKDWVYRPIGQALQKYGEDGTAILEKYLNGDDKILAMFAWRDLYIPWTPGAYNEMTTSQYEEAYLQLPDALKEFNVQKLNQNWEDKSIYNQAVPTSSNGFVGDAANSKGRWGAFNAGGAEVSDFVREGSGSTQSIKMVRGGGTGHAITGTFGAITEGQAYNMSFWLYRTKGATLTFTSRNAGGNAEIQGLIGDGGRLVFWDVANNKWGSDAIVTVPEDQWVQLTMNVSRLSGEITVSMTTEDGVSETAETKIPFNVATKVDRVVFTMSTVVGGTAYFDDISIVVASPVRPQRSLGASISMNSGSVRYDGNAHTLTAVTNLMGDTEPVITYKNAFDASAQATTEAPVDAGTYLATATAEYEGKSYTVEATLTIVPAQPTFDASKVTASAIAYGKKLNDSVLSMADGALTGIDGGVLAGDITWNNGGQYPVDTDDFTYTVNPADKNYASVSGVVEVVVEEQEYEPVFETKQTKIIDQNFDDTSIFTTATTGNVGSYNTTVGRWGGFAATGAYIVNTESFSNSQSVAIVRPGNALAVNMAGEASFADFAAKDYELRMMLKFMGTDKELGVMSHSGSNPEMTAYININGEIIYNDYATGSAVKTKSGLTLPLNQWVEVIFRVDREAGTFCAGYTTGVGTAQEKTVFADTSATLMSGGITSNISISPANLSGVTPGIAGYVDDVRISLLEQVKVDTAVYEKLAMLDQDFDNAEIFSLDKANASGYIYPGNLGGTDLDGANFNTSGEQITIVTEEDGNQCFRISRLVGELGLQYNATSKNSVGLDDSYEWSIDFKTTAGSFFTMGLGQGTYTNNEMSFIVGPNYIQSLEDSSKKLTFTQGEWTTVKFWANRKTGEYTFSIGDASATVSTSLIGTVDVNRFSIWGRGNQADNYIYVDDLVFTRATLIPPYDIVDVTLSDTKQVYDGSAKSVSVSTGDATEYTVWYNGSTTAPTAAGTYEVQALVTQMGYRGSAMGTLTIQQAVPASSGEAITYAKVAKGSKLEDIDLGISFTTPGTVSWDGNAAAQLTVSGDYSWCFIPTDSSNYASVSGSVYVNVQGGDDAVAQVGDTTYASLQQAVNNASAGQTVTLIGNAAQSGVMINKDLTVDFAGKAYAVTEGTMTFAEGAVVELKNGTITGNVGMLLQNAADLTLTDMVLNTTGTAIYNGPDRALTIRYSDAPETVTVTGGISINGASSVAILGGIFTAAIEDSWCAEGFQGVELEDGNWTVMAKDLCNGAKIGDAYYDDLAQALDAASDGEIVVMLRDAALDTLFISGGKVLDLNGKTLSVPGGLVTFAGHVIDSGDGVGLLVSGADNVIVSPENAQLPLYDAAAGGYRFFTYSFDSLGAYTESTTNIAVFGMRLILTNADGYSLLANADSGMTLKVKLRWEGMEVHAPEYSFSSDLMVLYAEKIQESSAYALLLRVSGAGGKTLTAEPSFETLTRMGATADEITHIVDTQA